MSVSSSSVSTRAYVVLALGCDGACRVEDDDGRREFACECACTVGTIGDCGGECRCGDDAARRARNGELLSSAGGSGEYGGGSALGPACAASSGMLDAYERARPVRVRAGSECGALVAEVVRERVRGGVGGGRTGVGARGESDVDDAGEGELLSGGASGVSTARRTAEELCVCVSMTAARTRRGTHG